MYRTYRIVLFVALILEFCDICHMKTIVILILWLSFIDHDLIKVEVKSVLRIGSAHNNARTSNVKIAQISNVSNFSEHKLYFIFS